MPHGSAIHVFAAIHQREKRAQNAGFDFVGHGKAACRHVHKRFASPRDLTHEFDMAFVAGFPERGFAAHFGAFLFDEESKVQNTFALRGESRRHYGFAAL